MRTFTFAALFYVCYVSGFTWIWIGAGLLFTIDCALWLFFQFNAVKEEVKHLNKEDIPF